MIICSIILTGIALATTISSFKQQKTSYCSYIVGLWERSTKDERTISLRVENRSIEDIIWTARHEICHEIFYRNNNYKFDYEKTEEFARICAYYFEDYIK